MNEELIAIPAVASDIRLTIPDVKPVDPYSSDDAMRAELKDYRTTDFSPHYRLYNDVCRLFEQAAVRGHGPEGTLQHLSQACMVETDLMPLQIQDVLDEYHVSHADVPAFPFRDFVMMGNFGLPSKPWVGVGAVLDAQIADDGSASAFTAFAIQQPGAADLGVTYMGVRYRQGHTYCIGRYDLYRIDGLRDKKGVLNFAKAGTLTRDVSEFLGVWTQWLRLQLLYIDLPRHHVIVETPRTFRKVRDGDKVVKASRAQDNEKVRLIVPEDLRKVYPVPASAKDGSRTDRTMSPHHRRGFTKLLSSACWKHKQGQRIVVRPTWVGPEDWEHKGLKYRVVKPNERT